MKQTTIKALFRLVFFEKVGIGDDATSVSTVDFLLSTGCDREVTHEDAKLLKRQTRLIRGCNHPFFGLQEELTTKTPAKPSPLCHTPLGDITKKISCEGATFRLHPSSPQTTLLLSREIDYCHKRLLLSSCRQRNVLALAAINGRLPGS